MSHISTIYRAMTRLSGKRPVAPLKVAVLLILVVSFLLQGCTVYARWLHVKGARLDLAGDYDSAAEYYRSALMEDPDLVQPRLQLANYYYWKRQYSSAEKEYMGVLERDPENARAKKALTQCRFHIIEQREAP